jgi:serine/threonine protein phosphatase 1
VKRFVLPERDLRVAGRRPLLPEGLRIYAIGDIHGRLDLLDKLLSMIAEDIDQHPTVRPVYVFLGDYLDRGPASRQTIDRLIEHNAEHESIFLKGNHEAAALGGLSDRSLFDQWLRMGGRETLASYGVATGVLANGKNLAEAQLAFHQSLPQTHLRFFSSMMPSFVCGDYLFVHAGVRPGIDLKEQNNTDLLWIRDEFLSSTLDFGKIVVHGHTPTAEIEVFPNRINIDTGAYATGRLTCLIIDNESMSKLDTLQT